MLHKPKPPSPGEGPSGGFEDQKHSSTSRKSPPAVPTTRTSDAEVQGRKDPTEICSRPRINPQPLQPQPSPQPPRHLQTEPFCRPGRVASAGGLNASDQHSSQARSGLSDNADLRQHIVGRDFHLACLLSHLLGANRSQVDPYSPSRDLPNLIDQLVDAGEHRKVRIAMVGIGLR